MNSGRLSARYDAGYDMHSYSSYHAGAPPTSDINATRNTANERSRLTQIISTNSHKLAQNVEQMVRLINQIGTATVTMELHDKLHKIQHYSNQVAKETNQCLKDLARLPPSGSSSERREQRLQQERLLNSFTTALNSFQSAQRKQKEQESMVHRIGQRSSALDDFHETTDKLVSIDHTSKTQQEQEQLEGDEDDELLREQEHSLQQLESDITDVNQIFKDLSVLIHEQANVVDSIESNVERSALNVDRGTEQLLHARDYQTKVRRRKICIIVVVIVIILIIAIIIGVSARH